MTNSIKEALWKFFAPRDEVLENWIGFADDFHMPSADFYEAVEKELEARRVPGLEKSRVELAEGGLLSEKRVYLRLLRERLEFYVCAAPFGNKCFFFSFRLVQLPIGIKPMELLLFLVGVGLLFGLLAKAFGSVLGFVSLLVILGTGIYAARNSIALGFENLDASLLKMPVIGPLYEVFLRRESYYRTDTRLMYLDTVSNVVKKLAEEVTGAKGVKLLRQYEQAPILGELYKPLLPRVETERKG